MFDAMLIEKAERLLKTCGERHMRVATAESCTGGLIAALLTEIPGSSVVIGRSFITYSNRAKREVLNVPAELLKQHGAVSEQVVQAMAQNTFDMTTAHLTVAVSGIAGPGGGSAENPPVRCIWPPPRPTVLPICAINLVILAAPKYALPRSMQRWI